MSSRYDHYNRYIEENPTVEDTEALLLLDLMNYFADTGDYQKLLQPNEYADTYADTSPGNLEELITTLQESGNNPYLYMGEFSPESSINMYTSGEAGHRAQFRQDMSEYINDATGERLTQKEFNFYQDESTWLQYLVENQDVDPKYKNWLSQYKYKNHPNVVNADMIRPITAEEKVDTLVINRPFTERMRTTSYSYPRGRHPLHSYVEELAHGYQYSENREPEYIDYLNDRVSLEHERFGDSYKYKNPHTVEYEAHSIIAPQYWDYLERKLQGEDVELNLQPVPSYDLYEEGIMGPPNYVRILNEEE